MARTRIQNEAKKSSKRWPKRRQRTEAEKAASKAKRDTATKDRDGALAEMVEQLANSVGNALNSDAFQSWAKAQSHFYSYSFNNVCWLIAQARRRGVKVTQFNTYKRWQKLGRQVKSGSSAFQIMRPSFRVLRDVDGNVLLDSEGNKRGWTSFFPGPTFDVSQTEGDALPAHPEWKTVLGNGEPMVKALKTVAEQMGVTVEMSERLSAEGMSHGGRIQIKADLAPAMMARTLAHELAHEILHHGVEDAPTNRGTRELEADATAYVILARYGLESVESTANYVAGWGNDAKDVLQRLVRIQKAASKVLDILETVLSPEDMEKAA